jgi:hypothetical protein
VTDVSDERRERKLRQLARAAAAKKIDTSHVDEPLLALIRDGDLSEDIADAVSHVAICADCRAQLTEGEISQRQVVVMAIEAPRGSSTDIERAAEGTSARLLERGDGRWMAVVDAEKSEAFAKQLNEGDSSVVSRLGRAAPVNVPTNKYRRSMHSTPAPGESGTAAAEVQAWAQVAREPRQRVRASGIGWVLTAIVAVLAAIGIAYALAIR